MTTRDILRAMKPGQSHTFETIDQAASAASQSHHLYGRKYTRKGSTVTRIE